MFPTRTLTSGRAIRVTTTNDVVRNAAASTIGGLLEQLEFRYMAGGSISLLPSGLSLSTPDSATAIVESSRGTDRVGKTLAFSTIQSIPALPDLSPEADPLSPHGDPASDETKDVATTKPSHSEGGYRVALAEGDPQWYVDIAVHTTVDNTVHERWAGTASYFRFSATPSCGSGDFPSWVTVSYTLSGVAQPGVDYDGGLVAGRTVVVPVGDTVDVGYWAVDDNLDETASESIVVTITGGTGDHGTAGIRVVDTAFAASGDVISGDFTMLPLVLSGNSWQTMPKSSGGNYILQHLNSSTNNNEKSIAIKVLQDNGPMGNIDVTATAPGNGVVFVQDGLNGAEVSTLTCKTGTDGSAYFKLRTKGQAFTEVTVTLENYEQRIQTLKFYVQADD